MKKPGNCYPEKHARCPFLRTPACQSGFTSQSGESTWWVCAHPSRKDSTQIFIRNIKKCWLAGDKEAQIEQYRDFQATGTWCTV